MLPEAGETSGGRGHLWFAPAVLGLSFLAFSSVWVDPGHRIAGITDDPVQNVWFLAWMRDSLVHGHTPFTTTLIDHPGGVNLLWNPLVPLLSLLLAPITQLAGPVVAYNLLVTLVPAASAIACRAMLQRFVVRDAAANVGALAYGFSPFVMVELLGHPHAALGVTPPLIVMVLHDLLVRRRRSARRSGLQLAGLSVAQFLISEEVLLLEIVVAALVLAILALRHRDQVRPAAARALAAAPWALVPFLAGIAIPLVVQLTGPNRVSGRIWDPRDYSPDVLDWVVPSLLQAVAPDRLAGVPSSISAHPEVWSAYLGVPMLLVVILAVRRLRGRPELGLALALAGPAAVLAFGPTLLVNGTTTWLPLPGRILAQFPFLEDVYPVRFLMFVWLGLALLIALLVDHWLALDIQARQASRVLPVVVAVALVACVPRADFPALRPEVPAFFTGHDVDRLPAGATVLALPIADQLHVVPMLWQAESGMRFAMTGGYAIHMSAGGRPTTAPDLDALERTLQRVEDGTGTSLTVLSPGEVGSLRAALTGGHVDAVIVGPTAHEDQLIQLLTAVIGSPPQHLDGVDVWWTLPAS